MARVLRHVVDGCFVIAAESLCMTICMIFVCADFIAIGEKALFLKTFHGVVFEAICIICVSRYCFYFDGYVMRPIIYGDRKLIFEQKRESWLRYELGCAIPSDAIKKRCKAVWASWWLVVIGYVILLLLFLYEREWGEQIVNLQMAISQYLIAIAVIMGLILKLYLAICARWMGRLTDRLMSTID